MAKFQVRVMAAGSNGILLLKTLRLVARPGLREAKELFVYLSDHAPCLLVGGVDREAADHVARLLREAGAEVSVEESAAETPMLLCPKVSQRYRWSFWWGPTPIVR